MPDYNFSTFEIVTFIIYIQTSLMCGWCSYKLFSKKTYTAYPNRHYETTKNMMAIVPLLALLINVMVISLIFTQSDIIPTTDFVVNAILNIQILLVGGAFLMLYRSKKCTKTNLIIFSIPCIAIVVAHIVAYIYYTNSFPTASYQHFTATSFNNVSNIILHAINAIYFIAMIALVFNARKHYIKLIDGFFSEQKDVSIKWLTQIIWGSITITTLIIINLIICNSYLDLAIVEFNTILFTYITVKVVEYRHFVSKIEEMILRSSHKKTYNEPIINIEDVDKTITQWVNRTHLHTKLGITIAEIATLTNISVEQITECLQQRYNKSFVQWINALRVDEIKQYISTKYDDTQSVAEIAYQFGFSNIQSLNAAFVNETGKTLATYIKETKEENKNNQNTF